MAAGRTSGEDHAVLFTVRSRENRRSFLELEASGLRSSPGKRDGRFDSSASAKGPRMTLFNHGDRHPWIASVPDAAEEGTSLTVQQ